jgi:hypothetical protein
MDVTKFESSVPIELVSLDPLELVGGIDCDQELGRLPLEANKEPEEALNPETRLDDFLQRQRRCQVPKIPSADATTGGSSTKST